MANKKNYMSQVVRTALDKSYGDSMKKATHILFNATVLTMDAFNTTASAIALHGEHVLAVGPKNSLDSLATAETEYTDMEQATILPGFYDAHGHFFMNADARCRRVDLNSPPIGGCVNLADCHEKLRAKAAETPEGQWVMAYGYDDTRIAECRFPTRWELDKVSAEHPIYVQHISGHFAVLNSRALEICEIHRDTPDPEGGIIRRTADGEPDGVLEESILYQNVRPRLPQMSLAEYLDSFEQAGLHYASRGITSTVDAAVQNVHEVAALYESARQNRLPVRVLYNPYFSVLPEMIKLDEPNSHVTRGGIKIIADGSLQGYTGYLSRPYHTAHKGDTAYKGYPRHSRPNLFELVDKVHPTQQFLAHVNGDAAVDDVLDALEDAQLRHPRQGHRHTLIHAQTIREDQLDRAARMGVSISFFTPHVYYWGDRHRDIFLGPERAARLNPMRSALQRNIILTSHCDAPIVPTDSLLSIWACVNRLTSSGKVLGADQRITVLEALRAHTINPAWQNFEEKLKGSLEGGKYADMVVLETNPLECPHENIRDIKILSTYVGGRKIYSA